MLSLPIAFTPRPEPVDWTVGVIALLSFILLVWAVSLVTVPSCRRTFVSYMLTVYLTFVLGIVGSLGGMLRAFPTMGKSGIMDVAKLGYVLSEVLIPAVFGTGVMTLFLMVGVCLRACWPENAKDTAQEE